MMTPVIVTPELPREALLRIAGALRAESVSRLDASLILGFLLGRCARRRAGVAWIAAWEVPPAIALEIGRTAAALVEEAWRE